MVPAQSPKDLILEGGPQEGIVHITIGQLFKNGNTSYTPIGFKSLKDVPPLPTGYVSFRDQAYDVTTDAMVSGEHVIIFQVPSVSNETEFKRLKVLHLEEDEMSPVGKSWFPVMVVPDAWDETSFQFISKTQYEQLLPDFSSRRIAAITQDFGVFTIAISSETDALPSEPFTRMELISSSVPETAKQSEQITHIFIIKNNGPAKAEEVNFKEELNSELDFESAVTTQGTCAESTRSNGRILCHLGPIAAGATVTLRVITRLNKKAAFVDDVMRTISLAELGFKQKPTDFIYEKTQIFAEVRTVVLKDP
jgi:hypothetical protein